MDVRTPRVGAPTPRRRHRRRVAAAAAARRQLPCTPRLCVTTPVPPCPVAAEANTLLAQWGKNELEEKRTPKWLVYLKHREWVVPRERRQRQQICPPARGSSRCHLCLPLPLLSCSCAACTA